MIKKLFKNPVAISHEFVKKVVTENDKVIDATTGNGYDTVFLAKLVGSKGRVYGFDIQPEAIEETRRKLSEHGLLERVILNTRGHEKIDDIVRNDDIKAVMFNLGYLPGSNHKIITRPETTIMALKKALPLLTVGGVISIVIYVGHPGGYDEGVAVENWASSLHPAYFDVFKLGYLNKPNNPPYFICVQKLKKEDDSNES